MSRYYFSVHLHFNASPFQNLPSSLLAPGCRPIHHPIGIRTGTSQAKQLAEQGYSTTSRLAALRSCDSLTHPSECPGPPPTPQCTSLALGPLGPYLAAGTSPTHQQTGTRPRTTVTQESAIAGHGPPHEGANTSSGTPCTTWPAQIPRNTQSSQTG